MVGFTTTAPFSHLIKYDLKFVFRSNLPRLSKKSFVGFHMAWDEGLFILDWRQFYRPKNGSVRLDQSE